ncbi:MAG: acyl-CoA dehydrogenase [Deltaproteobacteria bacterium]|nr:acyl-CoA dehydrogenase [Deltaproteobacteria bacterium]
MMTPFTDDWRRLAAEGAFLPFRRAADLRAGAARLEALGEREDELGLFISIIAGLGLAVPILEAAEDVDPSVGPLIDRMLAGEAVLAVAITEPDAGSDALAMRSEVVPDGDRLVLSGHKWHITNAPIADHAIVFAWMRRGPERFLSALLVPLDAPGVTRGPALDLIGARASPTGALTFEGVHLSHSAVLGAPTDGRRLLDRAFVNERLLAPWPLIGKMRHALGRALDHVDSREQFGKKIREFQYVQDKIVSAWTRWETTRLTALEALTRHAAGRAFDAHASLAKSLAADAAVDVFRLAIELEGSYGVQRDARLGQWLADALCAGIAGGTREMHKRAIFDQLVLDRARARRRGRSALMPAAATEAP